MTLANYISWIGNVTFEDIHFERIVFPPRLADWSQPSVRAELRRWLAISNSMLTSQIQLQTRRT